MTAVPVTAARRREPHRGLLAVAVVAVWVALFAVLRGRDTLALGAADLTDLHRALNGLADAVGAGRDGLVFTLLLDPLRAGIDAVVGLLRDVLAQPSYGRPVP
ncbi:MAG: ABC transporter permease, partial [Actinomycetota bacterium]|nr:ABC transporter permease [Actinomycetota bacterium]